MLLATRAYAYNQNTKHYELASVIEFIYTAATLLHDDVIDQSDQHHDQQTANVRLGNSESVFLGRLTLFPCLPDFN